jgi:hypothetical protein
MFNFHNKPVSITKIEAVMNNCKDWLRFSRDAWIAYTNLSNEALRDRLLDALRADDPSFFVLTLDRAGWAAYATASAREWLKKERNDSLGGE